MTESVSWADLVKDAGDVGTFEPVPDDDYDLTVTDAQYKPTKAGKKMWSTKNRIEGGPHNGRLVWDNLVVTPDSPNALMFFFRKMAVLGLSKEFFQANPSDQTVADHLKGKRFRATLETRTYQGTRSNSIKTYHQPQATPNGFAPTKGLPASVNQPPPPAAAAPPPPAAAAPAPAPAPQAAPAPAPAPVAETAPAPAPAPAAPAPVAASPASPEPTYAPPAPPVAQAEPEPVAAGGVPAPSAPPPPPF